MIGIRPDLRSAVRHALEDDRLACLRVAQPQLPFKYLRRNYLANNLSAAQRARILAHHYGFLTDLSDADFTALSRSGLPLWRHRGALSHEIRLRLAGPVDNEGELALDYMADGACIGVTAFSFAPAALFGQTGTTVPLVTRIQYGIGDTARLREIASDHNDIAPRMALASALQGLATGLRLRRIVAVARSNQVAYVTDQEAVQASSYDDFYRTLGGRPGRPGFFDLDVPLETKEPSQASSAHRRRSRRRRLVRQAVADAAEQVISAWSLGGSPAQAVGASPQRHEAEAQRGDLEATTEAASDIAS